MRYSQEIFDYVYEERMKNRTMDDIAVYLRVPDSVVGHLYQHERAVRNGTLTVTNGVLDGIDWITLDDLRSGNVKVDKHGRKRRFGGFSPASPVNQVVVEQAEPEESTGGADTAGAIGTVDDVNNSELQEGYNDDLDITYFWKSRREAKQVTWKKFVVVPL